MSSSPGSEDEIFEHALHLSGEARADYLKSALGGDEQMRQRIESLLEADDRAGQAFLHEPAVVSSQTLRVAPAVISVTERPGDKIGRYKLREQIGEGGCGVVYVAEQEEPVRRRVALKVIKLGMDTKQVVARFEAERQALALMDHPNIAKVLDAGATDTGRPYFVMELVRGIKITAYCDKHNLSTEERIKLFIQVCSAIQHAHQKGIIHRDIKPSNILVTSHDGVPVPKVIDFGIAKATTDQRLTDKTIYTAFEQFIGTPAYMSPEQAEMSGLDIDTRSDIYSLGVLLYELLTSRTPFDASTLLRAGLDQMRRIIREQEPQRPSTRLSTLDAADLNSVAQQRGSVAPKLVNLIRGDLDWIVMKSLEKDRTRRYGSVNALALDLQRHLGNEPVVARPPSPLYRLQKFARRNAVAVAATGLAVLAAAAALIIGMRISQVSGSHARPVLVPTPTTAATNTPSPPPEAVAEPPRLVSGIVLAGDTGRPLSNALVRVAAPSTDMRWVWRDTPDIYEGRTDAQGSFNIPTPPKATISLDAFYPGYESVSGTLMSGSHFGLFNLPFSAGQQQEFTIKLAPSSYVAGVVVDEEGRAFPKAFIEATMQRKDGMGYGNVKDVQTDAEGRFEIFDFPLKPEDGYRAQLTFGSPDRLRSVIDDVYQLSEIERKSVRVVLHRGHDIKGTVTSSAGRPAAHILVEGIPSNPSAQLKQDTTDADGRFVLRGLPDGDILVRTHPLALEQSVQVTLHLAGADLVTDLRLQPVVLKNPLSLVPLFGMKLADITPEIRTAYGLDGAPQGVLIVDPGENSQRLGIGTLEEGEYFWMVGNKQIANLREMVAELLRINEIEPSLLRSLLERQEGNRGNIRIVYSSLHWSNTQYMKLTDEDVAELKKLAAAWRAEAAGK
jgi:serine/threonine protein kinase